MYIFSVRKIPSLLLSLTMFLFLMGVVLVPHRDTMASTEKPETSKEELKAPVEGDQSTKGQPEKEDEIQKKIEELKKELHGILNDERIRKKIQESAEGLTLLLEIVLGVLLDELEQGVEKLKKNKGAYLEEIKKKLDSAKEILKKEMEKAVDSKRKAEDGKDGGTKDEKKEDGKQKAVDSKE